MEIVSKNSSNVWKEYAIKDIGTVVTGNTPPKKEPENYGGNLVWIKPPDLDKKMFVSSSEETISEIGKKKVRLLPKGSVLVSCIGNIGKLAIADCELCTNQQINSIIPNEGIADSVFLYYAIKRMKFYLEKIASSAVVPLLNKNDFSKIKIKIPPIETQNKIVEILETAEKLKEWRIEADQLANEYLKSVFLEIFGDPALNPRNFPINELKKFYDNNKPGTKCGPFGSALKKDEYVNSGIPVWIMDNIVNNKFIEEGCLHISEKKFEDLNSYSVENGDIIISRAGTVGKMCVVTSSALKSIISTNLIRLSLDDSKILPLYFTFLMTHFKERIGNLKTGSDGSYTFMNTRVLDGLKIPIPPIELQNQFAQIFQQVENLKSYQSQSKQQIDNLFNTLMQKAFKGELVC